MMLKCSAMPTHASAIWQPNKLQQSALRFLADHINACGLLLDPGVGKTSVALKLVTLLQQTKRVRRALVLAPLRVCYEVWPSEVRKWKSFAHLKTCILHGDKKNKILEEQAAHADLLLLNYEGLSWFLLEHRGIIKKLQIDLLVIDESSKLKDTHTLRYRTLKSFLPQFSMRWILTGSPTPQSLLDLFGQAYAMDLGATFGPYITHYRNQYFYPSGYQLHDWTLQPGAARKIYQRASQRMMRLESSDYCKLPRRIDNYIKVTLPAPARAAYDTLERDFLLWLSSGESVTVLTAATASNKLRQLANGAIYLDDANAESDTVHTRHQRSWAPIHRAKIDALQDLLSELQGVPLLVAYEFTHDRLHLEQRLRLGQLPALHGGQSMQQGKELIAQWNNSQLPVLLAQSQTAALGLNLQAGAGNHICWFGLTWNYETYDQLIRRLVRQGSQHQRVFVHHLIAQDTVDELLVQVLANKRDRQQEFFDALNQYRKRRMLREPLITE